MEYLDAVNTKKRMCKAYKCQCDDCPLSSTNNGTANCCEVLLANYAEVAEKILSDWAVAHPPMTNADKFVEVFGKDIGKEIFTDNCAFFHCEDRSCEECPGHHFWEKEYKEIDNGK